MLVVCRGIKFCFSSLPGACPDTIFTFSVVAETWRRWSDAEKQAIVAEAAQPGAKYLGARA